VRRQRRWDYFDGAVTRVHSGDGREVMTLPLGPVNLSSTLALPSKSHALEWTRW
jgi:hypothetical protein